ncbi:hypothetical protein FDZ73_15515 [bacterium]|nr:MAG: hypothetical protein FDZ73_15515 [bacterium]
MTFLTSPGSNVMGSTNQLGTAAADLLTKSLFIESPHTNPTGTGAEKEELARPESLRGTLDYFDSRAVLTPSFKHALDAIKQLIHFAPYATEPGGLLVIATGGCGKTFLRRKLLELYPPSDTLYELVVPIVAVEMDSSYDEKDLLVDILVQCGEHPNKRAFTANELEDKVVSAFARASTTLLFIDEANRLDTTTKRVRRTDRMMGPVGERLKKIYGRSKVVFVLAGTPNLEDLVDSDPQYKTRWSAKVRLKPFPFDAEFRGVIKALADMLPLPGKTDFSAPVLARALWEASQGNFRVLKTLIRTALISALQEGATCILTRHLKDAFLLTGDFDKPNPFTALSDE